MKSATLALNDALYDRLTTLLPGIPVRFEGAQGSAADYVLLGADPQEVSGPYTDKTGTVTALRKTLTLYGTLPRTLMTRAGTLIEALTAKPYLSVTGFTTIEVRCERDAPRTLQFDDTDRLEYARDLRFRFVLQPAS